MQKLKSLPQRSFGRAAYFKKSGARLYIPEKVVSDSAFPFKDGDIIKIEIEENTVTLKKTEWWEMLDWKTMPETFEKLPPDVQGKIRNANLI